MSPNLGGIVISILVNYAIGGTLLGLRVFVAQGSVSFIGAIQSAVRLFVFFVIATFWFFLIPMNGVFAFALFWAEIVTLGFVPFGALESIASWIVSPMRRVPGDKGD